MILKMDFEDEVFIIIPPGPEEDHFTLLKQHKDKPIDVPHMIDGIYHSREQAELNLLRYECKSNHPEYELKYWKDKYKKMANLYPEYVI